MSEIILSFFAVIGITLLAVHFFDYIFYRKFSPKISTIADLREYDEEEIIRVLELLSTVRHRKSGKAATGKLTLLICDRTGRKTEIVYHYMKIFDLIGIVRNLENDEQNDLTSAKTDGSI